MPSLSHTYDTHVFAALTGQFALRKCPIQPKLHKFKFPLLHTSEELRNLKQSLSPWVIQSQNCFEPVQSRTEQTTELHTSSFKNKEK